MKTKISTLFLFTTFILYYLIKLSIATYYFSIKNYFKVSAILIIYMFYYATLLKSKFLLYHLREKDEAFFMNMTSFFILMYSQTYHSENVYNFTILMLIYSMEFYNHMYVISNRDFSKIIVYTNLILSMSLYFYTVILF